MPKKSSKQIMSVKNLKQQEQELTNYLKTPGSKQALPSQQDEAQKKLTQIKQAKQEQGEVDSASRLNPRYGNANRHAF